MLQKVIRTCLGLALIVLLTSCSKFKKDEDLSAQQWNDLIRQNIPPGSSRADVEKFLDQRGIGHSYIAKSHFPDEANSIVAFVRSKDEGIVKKAGVQLKFKFDADQRLVSSEGRDMFTGP